MVIQRKRLEVNIDKLEKGTYPKRRYSWRAKYDEIMQELEARGAI